MIATSFGDMSRALALGRQNAQLKSAMTTLSHEMTTGQARDVARHLDGSLSRIAALEQSLAFAANSKRLAQTAATFLAAQNTVVTELASAVAQISVDAQHLELIDDSAATARLGAGLSRAFSDAVRVLNTRFGDRTLFAGTRGDGPALAAANAILDALMAEIPVPADRTTLPAQIEAWFAPGAGFDRYGYLGGPPVPGAIRLGQGAEIGLTVTAQDDAIRKTLAILATGAVIDRGVSGLDVASQRAILLESILPLRAAEQGLIDLSARLGAEEERAAIALSRAEAEHTGLAIARTELISVDPYEAASKLEQAMGQLDMIYMITARLSRLSLAEYLR